MESPRELLKKFIANWEIIIAYICGLQIDNICAYEKLFIQANKYIHHLKY